MLSAFTRSPLHLQSPNDDPVCRCPKQEPLSTVPSFWSSGPKLMAQEGSMSPTDFIQLTNSIDYPPF